MFGIRLLQPIQAIINKSHLGRLGASLIVANLPAWRCGWHRQAWDMFACILSIQNLSFQPKPLPQRGWPEFFKATFTKKPKIRRLQEPTKKKPFLASTCRCDLRKTANKLSLRKDPGDTGYPWAVRFIHRLQFPEVSYLSKPSGFFSMSSGKVNWGYLKLDLTWGSIVRTIDLISWWGALPGAGIRMVNDREGYNLEAKLAGLLRQKCKQQGSNFSVNASDWLSGCV